MTGSGPLVITRRAMEEAAALLGADELQRLLGAASGPAAADRLRAHLRAAVAAGRWLESRDPRSREPQHLVWLGPSAAPWGLAVVRDGNAVVTIVDAAAGGRVVARGRAALAPPRLRRDEAGPLADGVLLRYRAEGIPGVYAIEVLADGEARIVMEAR